VGEAPGIRRIVEGALIDDAAGDARPAARNHPVPNLAGGSCRWSCRRSPRCRERRRRSALPRAKGIVPWRLRDIGIGAAAIVDREAFVASGGAAMPYAPGETVIEATYRPRLTPWLKLQPDLQYVVNPGAGIPTAQSPLPLKNALIFGVRLTVDF
jgi:hypothetical protein